VWISGIDRVCVVAMIKVIKTYIWIPVKSVKTELFTKMVYVRRIGLRSMRVEN
jgi:hypothetical protein